MQIERSTVLVTGANRGLGRALVDALGAAGAPRIYAGSRRQPAGGSGTIALDVTDPASVAAAAARCPDVTILINNAGIARFRPFIEPATMEDARDEMAVNYFGTLSMCRAFAPILGANGGGMIVNILSVASRLPVPLQGSYAASKAAAWSLTAALRFELKSQGTRVAGVFAGYIDTGMTEGLQVPKTAAATIAERIVRGIAADEEDILADDRSRDIWAALGGDPRAMDAGLQALWDGRPKPAG